MSRWFDKTKSIIRDFGRKPYVSGDDDSYDKMMSRETRRSRLDTWQERKSVFDKPYLVDNYDEMEQYPEPDIPILPVEKSFDCVSQGVCVDLGQGTGTYSDYATCMKYCTQKTDEPPPPEPNEWCALTCHPPPYCWPAKDNPVECLFAIIHGFTEEELMGDLRAYIYTGTYSGPAKVEISGGGITGSVRPIKIYPPNDEDWTAWPPGPMDKIELQAWAKDDNGTPVMRCRTMVDVFCMSSCCRELPNGALAMDEDASSSTINPTDGEGGPGTATVFWTGGCAPYTLTSPYAGYYFDAGLTQTTLETYGNSVTVYCDGVGHSCDTGNVSPYYPRAYVLVVDDCGTSDWLELRNTVGTEWKPLCSGDVFTNCVPDYDVMDPVYFKNVYRIDLSCCISGTTGDLCKHCNNDPPYNEEPWISRFEGCCAASYKRFRYHEVYVWTCS